MGPHLQRRGAGRRRRQLLSTVGCLSAVTIFAFVSWFYIFRHDPSIIRHQQPPPVFQPATEKDRPADVRPDIGITIATASTGINPTETPPISSSSINPIVIHSSSSVTLPPSPAPTMKPSPQDIAASPVVRLRQGTYIGAIIPSKSDVYPKAVETFLGIPYAQSTAGENRFRPAVPVPDSTSTFQATAYGHACLGANSGRPEGEDCLNVNIFRPKGTEVVPGEVVGETKAAPRLPVVIYVHGGAFNVGHGGERNMASFVSWAKQDIIAVSFNYRVGAFGFLPSELTAREGLLNLGLRDQQALFAWVQDNIAAFGGDPENVTIMGLSAGAHSVGHHLMYYARTSSPPPFAKAILESGATTARAVFFPTHPRHLVQFREFLVAAGVEGVPEKDIFPALRKLPATTILKASKSVWDKYEPSVTWPFQPVIDGPNPFSNSSHTNISTAPVIPDLPLLSWQQGRHLSIPVLTGFSTNEGTVFVPPKASTNADFRSFFSTLIPGFSARDLDALEALYPDPVTNSSSPYKIVPKGMGAQWARLDAAYSHYAYICPVLQTAHYLSTSNSSSQGTNDASSFSKSVHNSYGLARSVGEAPKQPPLRSTPASSNPSADAAHNSYGLARSVGARGVGSEAKVDAGDKHRRVTPSGDGTAPNAPVYVYRYAAASLWGTANHGDEAPIVAHDMAVVSPPSSPGNRTTARPGLRAIADAMHASWTNFVVSRDGNPNPIPGGEPDWPVYLSPFGPDGGSKEGRTGKILVFGEGNNERSDAKTRHAGTPVKVESLTELDLERCRFWWDRVELSEGVGRRLDRGRL